MESMEDSILLLSGEDMGVCMLRSWLCDVVDSDVRDAMAREVRSFEVAVVTGSMLVARRPSNRVSYASLVGMTSASHPRQCTHH